MIIIKLVKSEEEEQVSMLFDDEGPNLTLRQCGKKIFVTIRGIIPDKAGWHTVVKNWCGLSIYGISSSRKKVIEDIKEIFGCEVTFEW